MALVHLPLAARLGGDPAGGGGAGGVARGGAVLGLGGGARLRVGAQHPGHSDCNTCNLSLVLIIQRKLLIILMKVVNIKS